MSEKIGVKRWYTVQVMSGQEQRVVESLTNRHQRNLDNGIDDGMEELLAEREYWRQQEARQLRSFDYAHIQRRFLSLLTPAGPEMPFPFDSLGGGGL